MGEEEKEEEKGQVGGDISVASFSVFAMVRRYFLHLLSPQLPLVITV